MDIELRKNLKFNYIVNVGDGAFFGMALGFASFSTIIPLFVSSLTDSAILIGLVVAMHTLGWQLPQLFVARLVSRQSRFKPLVMFLAVHERLPFLGLALTAFFLPKIGPTAALWLVFAMLAWQGIGGGVVANPWQNMLNKILPQDYLATFFGLQGAAANLLASGGAIAAGFILERVAYPNNYALVFIIACVFLVFSYGAVGLTREPVHAVAPPIENPPHLLVQTVATLKRDRNFRWLIVGRMLSQFGVMGSSFYFVHMVRNLGATEIDTGILTSVLMISSFVMNIFLGWLADRWSKRRVLEIGAVAMFLSGGMACLAPSASWFYPINIFASIANTCVWTIMMAIALQFGTDEERPLYVGMATTLATPATIVAPLLGGWLANQFGYPVTFAASAIFGIGAFIIFHFYVHDPHRTPATIPPAQP
jgi:MFS family permease